MPRGHSWEPRRVRSFEERYWEKVDKRSDSECWLWTGGRMKKGYGVIGESRTGRTLSAHRASYKMAHGDIPDDMVVMHTCDNPPCVNPAHLRLGTVTDNMRDMCAKGRSSRQLQTHCKSGHEFSPENTFRQSNGSRGCRTCALRWGREGKQRRRERERTSAAS